MPAERGEGAIHYPAGRAGQWFNAWFTAPMISSMVIAPSSFSPSQDAPADQPPLQPVGALFTA